MKHKRVFRLLGMIALLSILTAALPAAPVMGAKTLILNPIQAKVGDRIDYSGSGYTGSTSTNYYIDIYISDQYVSTGSIDIAITRYKLLYQGTWIDELGVFSGSFTVPTTLNEGTVGVSSPLTVTADTTYYIYATTQYFVQDPLVPSKIIATSAPLTITPGATLDALSPASGPAGSTVTISGTNFPASTTLVIQFDGTTVIPTGDTATRSSGIFLSTITVPSDAITGAHTITVTAGSDVKTATFTVSAPASINVSPASGTAGTPVAISGSNFPAGTVAITFDGASAPITGGSTQTSGGAFASFITIPSSATANTYKIVANVGTIFANSQFTVTGAAVTPTLNPLSATSGLAGSEITISGTNFPSGNIIITFDGTSMTIQSDTSTQTSDGSFSSTITIPSDATPGEHTITVTVGNTVKSAAFTVTTTGQSPTTSQGVLNIDQSGHNVGATIGISGAGFNPNTNIKISYDDEVITTIPSSAQGTFITTFNAPKSESGGHTITVTDGTNTANTTFTVESTAPKVPPPLKPELGAKVKSPILFDWDEVTDESKPVTYRLQIATDKSFGLGSVVLDKTGIEGSSYTLSEIEELKLTVQETPYYWRIKAVDAASNESEWTGASGFYISGPFKFPTWAIYLSIIGGAIVCFLLGLWVGRRTAFYY